MEIIEMLIVGLGGVGSQVIDQLFLNVLTSESLNFITYKLKTLYLCDFDLVEEKNLINQLYNQTRIGSQKLEIQSQNLKECSSFNIIQLNKKIQDVDLQQLQHIDLIIGCVDNVQTRRYITSTFPNTLIIDFGSEGLQASIRLYRQTLFAPFAEETFLDEDDKILICQQQDLKLQKFEQITIQLYQRFIGLQSAQFNLNSFKQYVFNYLNNDQYILQKFSNQIKLLQQDHQNDILHKIINNTITTNTNTNAFAVNYGLHMLRNISEIDYDLVSISFQERFFINKIQLQSRFGVQQRVMVQNGKIVQWELFNIGKNLNINNIQCDEYYL